MLLKTDNEIKARCVIRGNILTRMIDSHIENLKEIVNIFNIELETIDIKFNRNCICKLKSLEFDEKIYKATITTTLRAFEVFKENKSIEWILNAIFFEVLNGGEIEYDECLKKELEEKGIYKFDEDSNTDVMFKTSDLKNELYRVLDIEAQELFTKVKKLLDNEEDLNKEVPF